MTFTQIPEQFAPTGEALVYRLTTEADVTLIHIRDAASDALLGAKRYVGAGEITFDIAPIVRRALHFSPTDGHTALYSATGRNITVRVEAAADNTQVVVSDDRTFLSVRSAVTAPALLTTLPAERLIARGEADELTLLTATADKLTLTAQRGGNVVSTRSYDLPAGESLFRLNTADFADAETITVDAGVCGRVNYTLISPVAGGCRLAWRSSADSVEHYTFPVEKSTELDVAKTLAYGRQGYSASKTQVERKRLLVSAYETPAMLDALAEIIASPEVWRIENGAYVPVDVLTGSCTVKRDTVGTLEIEIRKKSKIELSWN